MKRHYRENIQLLYTDTGKLLLLLLLSSYSFYIFPNVFQIHSSTAYGLNQKFKQWVIPTKDMCIDESMIAFQGRLIFKQYIQTKRHRYGIKVFKLC
jgi:hypothetical protein